jgi:hypothetical protein
MPNEAPPERFGKVRASRVTPLHMVTVLALSVFFSSGNARGDMYPAVGPVPYGDDWHSAWLNPYPATPITQGDSIDTGLKAFLDKNPSDGSGPSHESWNFHWAGADAAGKVLAGLKILDYFPYVVNQPSVTAGDGVSYPGQGPGEFGGAVFNLKYVQQDGAQEFHNLHWIQAYTGRIQFSPVTFLDNDPYHPGTAQSSVSPFYDTLGVAGNEADVTGWFLDTPLIPEDEFEFNPVATLQFQVVLADDAEDIVNGVIQNDVTLYGGYTWGFSYQADEMVPEPSAYLLWLVGGCALLVCGKIGRQRAKLPFCDRPALLQWWRRTPCADGS